MNAKVVLGEHASPLPAPIREMLIKVAARKWYAQSNLPKSRPAIRTRQDAMKQEGRVIKELRVINEARGRREGRRLSLKILKQHWNRLIWLIIVAAISRSPKPMAKREREEKKGKNLEGKKREQIEKSRKVW